MSKKKKIPRGQRFNNIIERALAKVVKEMKEREKKRREDENIKDNLLD